MDDIDEFALEVQTVIKENDKRLTEHHKELYGKEPEDFDIDELLDDDLEV